MFSRWFAGRRLCHGLARAVLASAVWLIFTANGTAQEPTPPRDAPKMVLYVPAEDVKADKPAASAKPDAAAPAAAVAPAAESCAASCCIDWSKIPPVMKLARPGNFGFLPTGCGYYSLLDQIQGNLRDKPPVMPWPPLSVNAALLADNDFRYLDKPDNETHDFFDPIKRIHIGNDWLLSIGGEERVRYMHELDSRFSGITNDYTLMRSRLYTDLWYQDKLRVYVEFLDARSWGQELAPLGIDVDKTDLLNAFVDVKVGEVDCNPIYVRVGRQEMALGSQRLISALDWANTRRTFEGIRGIYRSEKFDADVFWLRPEVVAQSRFDQVDYHQQFGGAFVSYKPEAGQAIDFYYLYLDRNRPVPFAFVRPIPGERRGLNDTTIGSRYSGDHCNFLWDVEAAYQFGDAVGDSVSAGMVTTGAGYHFADAPTKPVVWLYYDYASGDDRGRVGGTFNQLYPFGHYYLGAIDLVGRQNINDLNMHVSFYPTNWIVGNIQLHHFELDSARDALYSKGSGVERRSANGTAGRDVGDEIDLVANLHLTRHSDILIGWSKLFAGDFIKNTATTPAQRGSPELYYLCYSYKW